MTLGPRRLVPGRIKIRSMVPGTIRSTRQVRAAAWLAALAAGGCGGSAPLPGPETAAPPDKCILPTGEPGEPRELVVAAVGPEDSAIVARRRREPLIRLDCFGVARPGAAESWTPDSSHRTWTFVLAPSALDITASGAATEWTTRPDAATALRYAGVVSAIPLDDRRLVVTLDRPTDSVPPLFADPSLGLVTDSLPPTGTTFVARRPASGDPRDALDAGADILRTGDPAILEYARTRPGFTVHPLPWSRTYLLVVPPGSDGLGSLVPADSAAFRAGLARDAVRAEARGAEPPFWWEGMAPCPPTDTLPFSRGPIGSNAVVYAREDPVARALAERVVALSDQSVTAAGSLPGRSMARALREGVGRAYVVAVPRPALVPCREAARWPAGSTLIPLIDTRMSVIVRRGVPRLTVELDGGLRAVDAP
jgi:hypothetical protein